MTAPTETEPTNTVDESAADQESRLKRYDQRIEEWLTSLKDGAEQRSPEGTECSCNQGEGRWGLLGQAGRQGAITERALGGRGEEIAELRRSPRCRPPSQGTLSYRGPDPESDPKGDGDHEDQGT